LSPSPLELDSGAVEVSDTAETGWEERPLSGWLWGSSAVEEVSGRALEAGSWILPRAYCSSTYFIRVRAASLPEGTIIRYSRVWAVSSSPTCTPARELPVPKSSVSTLWGT